MTDAAATPAADTPEYREQLLGGPQKLALLIGLGGLVAYLALAGIVFAMSPGDTDGEKNSRIQSIVLPYLTGFTFWMLVGFGSVFFLMIQYVTGGRWGILLRRPLEANSKVILFGFILFLPIAGAMFMGNSSIYWWAHEEAPHEKMPEKSPGQAERFNNVRPNLEVDEEKKKEEWLNPWFTVARGFAYIGIFAGLAFWMWKNAKTAEYDENLDVARAARKRQKYVGSFGLFVFAITLTFIATDWLVSLEPTFASSMFPVIVFDNAAVISYSIGLLTLLYLKKKGDSRFTNMFPATEQIHLGSLLLAFTLAWTYFNFSQYMLIWIGNLPEEIPYYLKRTREGWGWYAALAVIFHFPIPFLLLLFRHVKSSPRALRNIAIMLLCVVFIDVMWWISPSMSHEHSPKFYWLMDVAATVGIGGVWMYLFFGQLKKHPLLPTREIYLLEAYHHGH
jgi:heme/copper-type cytochrome/quinol oxidase subunit 4